MASTEDPPSPTSRRTIFPRSVSTGSMRRVYPAADGGSPPRRTPSVKELHEMVPTLHEEQVGESEEGECVMPTSSLRTPPTSPIRKPLKSCLSVGNELSSMGGNSAASSRQQPRKMKKNVSFHAIEIREHPRELGDHPATAGPALSLGWYREEEGSSIKVPLEHYKKVRPMRRSRSELCVPSRIRQVILQEEVGVTMRDMALAQKEAAKIRNNRRKTNAAQSYDGAHYVWESCARKVKRFVTGGSSSPSKKLEKDLMERAKRLQELQQLQQQHWASQCSEIENKTTNEKEHGSDRGVDERGADRLEMEEDPTSTATPQDHQHHTIPKASSDSFLPVLVPPTDDFTLPTDDEDDPWEF